jgi:GNAT superfamily N-acetyltransferase
VADVSIRRATCADAARLAALSEVLGYPVAADALAERLGRLLGRDEELVLVAEEIGGDVVGWLHGSEQELLESGRRCEILGLVVDGTHRGRGVGRRLVQAVEAWASARGLDQMAVRSNVARAESHPFYERLGYVRTKTQHAYRKHLEIRMTTPWPFEDTRNTAAITTRQVLEGAPILRVAHDADDGSWQFLCGTTDETSDGRVVGLGSLCDRDPSLLGLADLPEGWSAWRERPGAPWRRNPA